MTIPCSIHSESVQGARRPVAGISTSAWVLHRGVMMHYYKRNIGDYAKKAGRLSMLQHGSYTLLIDACYDREQFPTMEDAIEWTWASTTEEIEAVQFVLRKFFTLVDGVYVETHIQNDLTEYHLKAEINKRIAHEREANRRENSANRAQYVNEPSPNHKPLTTNHEPVNPLSDKSDGVRLANGKQKFKDDAIQVLEFLNLKTGKHYRPLKANLDLIAARLAEGAQVSDCRGIIVRQARKWMGTDQEMYLRPATLFNATKFAQYSGEISHD